MKIMGDRITHTSAQPSHYDKEAQTYDLFNEKNAVVINKCIEKIVKKQNVKTIGDFACGTGLQTLWFARKGYKLVGVDISTQMLAIAKSKAAQEWLGITFINGDMRSTKAGEFDAVITIFNAIGHLTKKDFVRAIKNIHANLADGGIYIFDIFNLSYLLKGDNITKLTIDWLKKVGDTTVREIQYSTMSHDGILASYDIYFEQKGNSRLKTTNAF